MPGTIGWLGTGRMGTAIVTRLLDGGRPVTVWNRTSAKTGPLAARGAKVADSIVALGACDVVFVMVSGPRDLEEVVLGEGGLLSAETRPQILVDCSTVSEVASARIRAACAAAGVAFLAAPVCGNPDVFADGQGSFIVSGPEEVFETVRPDLELIAKTVVLVGDAEQARLVKLAHNLYLGMMVQSLVEVVTLAEKAGTSRAAFLEFFNGSALTSAWIQRRGPELVDRDWHLTFTNELLRKDFDLGLAAARELEVPMPATSTTYHLIQSAIGHGLRDEDFLSLYEQQASSAGL
jgi:3-hydroxyisobutyrate dehydrogenase-like beta-hydroxyacid dehydrogenase